MNKFDNVILGINHMFLYPESMCNGDVHTATLHKIAENPEMDALDCWVWASHSKEEIQILRNCGKQINYNIGDRVGEIPVFPATKDAKEKQYAKEILHRETDFAVECGAKKIVFASGKDVPEDRVEAQKRFEEFVMEWLEYIPKDIILTLEPTDRDVDKFFLYGDLDEACKCVSNIQKNGHDNMGILLDMGHIPIMHETLESAVKKLAQYLQHIHLGNAVIKDKMHPYYGDKHPYWGIDGGEYSEQDGAHMLQLLANAGYFSRGTTQTISFEMRPFEGKTVEQTVSYLKTWFYESI